MNELKGKKALVTGGNSGIGYATAQLLKERGAEVIISGRSEKRVAEAAATLGLKGYVADVSNLAALDQLLANVRRDFSALDILFVNAGVFQPSPLGQLSESLFDEIMNINFKGAVFTIEKFLPILREGASIINLSSINAYTGMANTSIYAASKAALNSYTRTASTELAPKKIRINSVNPGPIETPIFGKVNMEEADLQAFASAMQKRIPLKRFGKAEEVAELVAFLASDAAGFITGGEYNIDGGMNINPGLSLEG